MLVSLRMVLILLAGLNPGDLRLLDEELILRELLMMIVQMIVQMTSVSEFVRSDELISSRSLITSVLSADYRIPYNTVH